jgi:hypothetical protein
VLPLAVATSLSQAKVRQNVGSQTERKEVLGVAPEAINFLLVSWRFMAMPISSMNLKVIQFLIFDQRVKMSS